jgi:mannose-6-phosphate isomerase-like protein (cupin superfamily)
MAELDGGGAIRRTLVISSSLGFQERDGADPAGAVVVRIPSTGLDGAEDSVCGLKAFLVDEVRAFERPDGARDTIACAKVAALDIVDSPVHVHGETVETYHILAGSGRMVLGDRVVALSAGNMVVIPPGVPHGLCADDPDQPVRVVMTFSPGLAPIQHQEWRDERICAPAASARIAQLEAR